jgi:hypothetical protein
MEDPDDFRYNMFAYWPIITGMLSWLHRHNKIILIIILLGTAAFLRLYRINALTQFLGDQGSAGVIIYNAWKTKTLPLVGPAVSTGEYPGPFYYYLVGLPFILTGFNPLAPAIFMALLGVLTVYLIYYLVSRLSGFWVGILAAFVWATSSLVVALDQTNWNPTTIPLFITLVLISMYQIWERKRYGFVILLFLADGILVQLHYTNIYTVAVSVIFWLTVLIVRHKNLTFIRWFTYSLEGLAAFLSVLSPFIYYETRHKWTDISGLAGSVRSSETVAVGLKAYIRQLITLSGRPFEFIFPGVGSPWIYFIVWGIMILALLRFSGVSLFFCVWWLGGSLILAKANTRIFDHYLLFLEPLPVILIGYLIGSVKHVRFRTGLMIFFIALIILNLSGNNLKRKGYDDLSREPMIVDEIIRQSGGHPFSFALMSSRSFSDYHLRYFFRIKNVTPLALSDTHYAKLFLVCEQDHCDSDNYILNPLTQAFVPICYDLHCQYVYPAFSLGNWVFASMKDIPGARIYTYNHN